MRGKHIVLRVMNIPLLTLDITEMERATSREAASNAKGIGVMLAPERRPGVYVLDEAKPESQSSVATPVTESKDSGLRCLEPILHEGNAGLTCLLAKGHTGEHDAYPRSHSGSLPDRQASPMRSDDGD